ncbi:MAG: hypothetical protein OXI18_11655 [bacterium]|nr:hypothetical protein [bacterium]
MVIWRWTVGLLVAALVFVTAINVAATEPVFDLQPTDAYGSPCPEGRVDPSDSYCDMEIVHADTPGECDGVSDTLNPPDKDSGSAVIRVVVGGEPAEPGDYQRYRCELWFRPYRIHQRFGGESVGVRIDWPLNQVFAFTVGKELVVSPTVDDGDVEYYSEYVPPSMTTTTSTTIPMPVEDAPEAPNVEPVWSWNPENDQTVNGGWAWLDCSGDSFTWNGQTWYAYPTVVAIDGDLVMYTCSF